MKITEIEYDWKGVLSKRKKTLYIILHHRAGDGDVSSIHKSHIKNGWTGIGYHFYVRKDGSIFRGRPLDTIGAHCTGKNSVSVGVCFEGNFEKETMCSTQKNAGAKLIEYLKNIYPSASVLGHRDLNSTACPGKNFPIEEIKKETKKELTSPNDITWELNHSFFEITDTDKFVRELEEAKKKNSSLYWGYYKLVNRKGV